MIARYADAPAWPPDEYRTAATSTSTVSTTRSRCTAVIAGPLYPQSGIGPRLQLLATKAERFKVEQQRAAHARRAQKSDHTPAGKRARGRGRRKDGIPNPASHNEAARAARGSLYEHEVSATTRPSRRSSRKSAGRTKTDATLRIATMTR